MIRSKSNINEEWVQIKGFEGLYEISGLGRTRSVDRVVKKSTGFEYSYKGRMLKLVDRGNGYLFATLVDKDLKVNFSSHRGVAEHFVPNPNNLPQVNHKDGNKKNNNKDNLEWCTASENSVHAYDNNLRFATRGESHGNSKLTESDVKEIRKLVAKQSNKSVASMFNVTEGAIRLIEQRKRWAHVP